MATAKYIDLGFTIADAEYPALAFGRGELTLMFRDYRGDNIRVVFRDVWWFEWLDEVPDDDQIPGELGMVLRSFMNPIGFQRLPQSRANTTD